MSVHSGKIQIMQFLRKVESAQNARSIKKACGPAGKWTPDLQLALSELVRSGNVTKSDNGMGGYTYAVSPTATFDADRAPRGVKASTKKHLAIVLDAVRMNPGSRRDHICKLSGLSPDQTRRALLALRSSGDVIARGLERGAFGHWVKTEDLLNPPTNEAAAFESKVAQADADVAAPGLPNPFDLPTPVEAVDPPKAPPAASPPVASPPYGGRPTITVRVTLDLLKLLQAQLGDIVLGVEP